MTETHTCNCAACGGITFTAPSGYIPASDATMVHNYAQMTQNPVIGPVMARRGVTAA